MGALLESFSNLTELLLAGKERDIFLSRVLKPLLPISIRCGPGTLIDIKDRNVGPVDIIAASEAYPPLGDGGAALYPVDGAVFCLQVRHWAKDDLTTFGELSSQVKRLERRPGAAVFCAAVSLDPLSLEHVMEFLRGPSGRSVDGILSVGENVVIRNVHGVYGDPAKIPFVTERGGPEALKAFVLCLLQQAQAAANIPFGLATYQHL